MVSIREIAGAAFYSNYIYALSEPVNNAVKMLHLGYSTWLKGHVLNQLNELVCDCTLNNLNSTGQNDLKQFRKSLT